MHIEEKKEKSFAMLVPFVDTFFLGFAGAGADGSAVGEAKEANLGGSMGDDNGCRRGGREAATTS